MSVIRLFLASGDALKLFQLLWRLLARDLAAGQLEEPAQGVSSSNNSSFSWKRYCL